MQLKFTQLISKGVAVVSLRKRRSRYTISFVCPILIWFNVKILQRVIVLCHRLTDTVNTLA
jgi:hypothetical protein